MKQEAWIGIIPERKINLKKCNHFGDAWIEFRAFSTPKRGLVTALETGMIFPCLDKSAHEEVVLLILGKIKIKKINSSQGNAAKWPHPFFL